MNKAEFNLQPTLENNFLKLIPLKADDFERLYQAASDPLIWEQHPNKNRYQKPVFANYFEGAITSKGAFLIVDKQNEDIIGSTRFYDYDANKSLVLIGYTFLARKYWGGKYNPAIKALLLDYAHQYVEKVHFHIGASNIRSQKAIEKIGAEKIGELEVAYYGEPEKLNFIYEIRKKQPSL